MYDYVLGGMHNFPADREAAERIRAQAPELEDAAWANRAFHQRAARWMADQGIRQFVDIGSGLPTPGSTHGVAQRVWPDARVAYVDNDPIIRAYASELLTDDGTTTVITADMRDPDLVLNELRGLVDFDEPTGLLITAVLNFVADSADPWALVAQYVKALAPGSYVALSHATYDRVPPRLIQASTEVYARTTQDWKPRPLAEVERFFSGLEIVSPFPGAEPKVTHLDVWGSLGVLGSPDPEEADAPGSDWWFGGVARRPDGYSPSASRW
jgi:S-adenosyl methyltransferase